MSKKAKQNTKKSTDELTSATLHNTKQHLNISAGRVFYEKAKSRRSRHRDALESSQNCVNAVALGTSKKRKAGPNQTATVRSSLTGSSGEYETSQKIRKSWDKVTDLHAEKDQEIFEEIMNSGSSLAMKAIERGASRELYKGNSDRSLKSNNEKDKKSEWRQKVAKQKIKEQHKQRQKLQKQEQNKQNIKSPRNSNVHRREGSSSIREAIVARNAKHQQPKSSGFKVTATVSTTSKRGDETMKIQKGSSKSADKVIDLLSSDSSDDGGIDI
ncbi:predicted protein [Chaetoceros tenuissimus]|uniref:Uncharacterized protein n=1 Tax=Chaetoceros tenuissimus TaxID=426638 RepID=A0AAD3DCT3_9STRA|nr:predicted protein [Chaetoceros tenuissimus]